jgi:hypothetical protein
MSARFTLTLLTPRAGLPLSELEPFEQKCFKVAEPSADRKTVSKRTKDDTPREGINGSNSIVFSRRRMLYGRSGSEGKGQMRSGLGTTRMLPPTSRFNKLDQLRTDQLSDVLSRYNSLDSKAQTVHVINYIFPRQFGLQNVFTSTANGYANTPNIVFREPEISRLIEKEQLRQPAPNGDQVHETNKEAAHTKLPKRLRGQSLELVRRLRVRHSKCPYRQLLDHYCPDEVSGLPYGFDCLLILYSLSDPGNLAPLLLP